MKSTVLILLGLSIVNAVNVATGTDCSPSNAVCPSTDCCGTASKTNRSSLKIC